MRGRKEFEKSTNEYIKKHLDEYPKYITNYYYSLAEKSHTTKINYINKVNKFLRFLDEQGYDIEDVNIFKEIKPSLINIYTGEYLAGEGCNKAANFYAIKNFFKFLENDEYIDSNPCNKATPPKDRKKHEIVALTPEEIETIKNNIINGVGSDYAKSFQKDWKNRDMAIVMLGLSLGLRIGSIIEMNVEDIDFENQKIKIVVKGNIEKDLFFSAKIKQYLLAWLEDREELMYDFYDDGALFINSYRNRLTYKSVNKLIKKYTYNIDKKITPHKLRSTCATNIYNMTGDIYLTANVLGHSNIQNTKRYAKISEKKEREAAELMDKFL